MEWFIEEPRRGQTALTIIVLIVAGTIVLRGRKKLFVSVPIALALLIVAAIAIPGAIPARLAAQRNACIFNLKSLQGAKEEWIKQRPSGGAVLTSNVVSELTGRPFPVCPRGGSYLLGEVGEDPTCTLSKKGHRLKQH